MSLKNNKERQTRSDSNGKKPILPSLTPGALVTIIISLIGVVITLTIYIMHNMMKTVLSASEYLTALTVITVILLMMLIALSITINLIEYKKDQMTKKKQAPHQRFPIGVLNKLSQPSVIFDPGGTVVWGNASFCAITPHDIIVNAEKYKFHTLFAPKELIDTKSSSGNSAVSDPNAPSLETATAEELFSYMADTGYALSAKKIQSKSGEWYLHAYRHISKDSVFYLLVMTEVTELKALKETLKNDRPVCAYIVIDNLTELVSREQESYRKASADVDKIIKEWASELDAVIKEYERDKYIMIFRYAKMKQTEGFGILEKVREIKAGKEDLSVTVSIGVSKPNGTLLEKEISAQNALDIALKRGGNQAVVYSNDTDFRCFGGKDEYKPQSHSSVHIRMFAERLCAAMNSENCKHVIIMGHKNPDFDSLGSCAGIARLALSFGKEVKLIINEKDSANSDAIAKLHNMPEYALLFKDYMDGLDKIPDKSILVCCDVNNYKQFESPELVTNADNLFIIDHHRTNEFTPALTAEMAELKHYDFLIVPSASSASELVSEILEHSLPSNQKLATDEADLMFAGILLDTKQFTRNAQAATFSAALYLRNNGADPTKAQALFKTNLDDYRVESGFGTDVFLEREFIAIAKETGEDSTPAKRIAAAKTADRLLNIKNIRASFAIARMGDDVFISARSDGSINVQLIMEALGGGGHYNAAATMLKEISTENAITKLCIEIKKYFGEYTEGIPNKTLKKELSSLVRPKNKTAKKS